MATNLPPGYVPQPIVVRERPGCLLQLIWFFFVGWWLGLAAIIFAYTMFLFVITIPLGVMVLTGLAGLMFLLPLSALAADAAPRPLKGDVVHGKKLYDQHCLSCHGSNGVGKDDGVRLTDSGRTNAG